MPPITDEPSLAYLGFRRQNPSRLLADHVDCYWAINREASLPSSRQEVISISQSAGISCRQLERIFKKYVGITPVEFLRLKRVEMARKLLKKIHPLSCTEIAYETGFYDQSHFIRNFRAVTGVTPTAYQNRKRMITAL